jgi:hypothetical protein
VKTLVLCPTRGRPGAAREAYTAFGSTKVDPDTAMLFVVDDDDPRLPEYNENHVPILVLPAPGNMVNALNGAADWALTHTSAQYLGFVGDDHRFRTPGWDRLFTDLLDERGGGLVYGNDGYWPNGEIPTQIVMSASIVRALGWMGLPTCTHLYIDNAWRVIGETLGRLFYMPDVLIEHMHPAAGKSEWTPGHQRVNTSEMYDHDAQALADWLEGPFEADLERVREALA